MNSNILTIKLGTPSSIDGGASPNASISVQDMSQCESIALRDENGVKCTKVGAMATSLALISQTVSDKEINGSHVTLPLILIEGQDANISDEQWYDTFAAIEALRDYTAQDGSSISGSITVPYCPPSALPVLAEKYPDLTINVDDDYEELFEDKEVIRILRENLAADKKHIKHSEVQSTDMPYSGIGGKFKGTDIKSFNEFERFTNCTRIRRCGFDGCSKLESIIFPNSFTKLEEYQGLFKNCVNLKNVVANNWETTELNCAYAFQNCVSLESISLPNLTKCGNYFFVGCTSLKDIDLPKVKTLDYNIFGDCKSLKKVFLPEVEEIGNAVFNGSAIEEIDLPNLTIMNGEFANLPYLKKVNIPLVTSLRNNHFKNCTSLQNINLANVITVGNGVFDGCTALETVSLPKVCSIGASMFNRCTNLQSVDMPLLEEVGALAFANCTSLISINSYNIKTYNYGSFSGCGIKEFFINPDAVFLDGNVFADTNVEKMHFYEGFTAIRDDALYGSNTSGYKYIVLPNSLEFIGRYSFDYFSAKTLICAVIGTGIKTIGAGAFSRLCTQNRQYKYYIKATTPPTVAADSFAVNRNGTDWQPTRQTFYVPTSAVNAYKSAPIWSDHASQIVGYDFDADPDGVNSLPLGLFAELPTE